MLRRSPSKAKDVWFGGDIAQSSPAMRAFATTSHSLPIGNMNADCESSRLLMSLTAAHRWLQSSFADARPLLRSYEGGCVCYTYDQAVGVCAFVALGDFDSAHRLLLALSSLQLASGGFYTAYWENGSPQEYNQHVGPVLWVALAAFLHERYSGSTEFRSLGTHGRLQDPNLLSLSFFLRRLTRYATD